MSDHTPPRAAPPPPPPALAWKVPGKPLTRMHAAAELYCLQRTAVFQVVCALGLCRIRKPAPSGESCCRHSRGTLANFGSFSSARANATSVCLQPVPAQIAICEIADPHPLHHGKGVHPATRPLLWIVPSSSRIWAVFRPKQLSCGPAPTLVSGRRPATVHHRRTASTQHAHTLAGSTSPPTSRWCRQFGNCPIISALPKLRTRQPEGGAWTFRAGLMIHKGDCPTIACGCDVARVR